MDAKVRIYPHNDLLTLAWYHLKAIQEKRNRNELVGLRQDAMSTIIAMAFSVEALINFVGFKRVPEWKERASYDTKFKTLQKHLRLVVQWDREPFLTLLEIKQLRDQMAHGKPIEVDARDIDDDQFARLMMHPWDGHLGAEFVEAAYKQVVRFESQLLKGARIQAEQAVNRSSSTRKENLASGVEIKVTRRQTFAGSRKETAVVPPRSIKLDAEAITRFQDAMRTMARQVESPGYHGPPPRSRFPRPR